VRRDQSDLVNVRRWIAPCALAAAAAVATAAPTDASVPSAVPASLVGSYTTRIGKAAYPVLLPGRYTIAFGVNGTLRTSEPGRRTRVTAVVTIAGSRIDFSASPSCPTASGSYRWNLSGRVLTFRAIADRCGSRVLTLARRNWVKAFAQ
jgi:hypothetical protein